MKDNDFMKEFIFILTNPDLLYLPKNIIYKEDTAVTMVAGIARITMKM